MKISNQGIEIQLTNEEQEKLFFILSHFVDTASDTTTHVPFAKDMLIKMYARSPDIIYHIFGECREGSLSKRIYNIVRD